MDSCITTPAQQIKEGVGLGFYSVAEPTAPIEY